MECVHSFKEKSLDSAKDNFKKKFPQKEDGNYWNEKLRGEIEYIIMEAIDCNLPGIIDISIETFGELVPRKFRSVSSVPC